jgi:hypothetical protein
MTPRHKTTIEVACPTCFVEAGQPCVGVESRRRVPRLHTARYFKPAAEKATSQEATASEDFLKIDAISFADASPMQLLAAARAGYVLNRNNYVLRCVNRGRCPGVTFGRRVSEAEGAAAFLVL